MNQGALFHLSCASCAGHFHQYSLSGEGVVAPEVCPSCGACPASYSVIAEPLLVLWSPDFEPVYQIELSGHILN